LIYSLLGAVILVYLPFMAVGFARVRLGYDYQAPRAMFDKLPPYAQRATWAHQNAFESIGLYAPAALAAYVTGVESPFAAYAAATYLLARTLYPLCYVANWAVPRSAMFALGSTSCGVLYVLSVLRLNAG